MDNEQYLAAKIARELFAFGSEPSRDGGIVQRIQFVGGKYPDHEIALGGLCETALARAIRSILSANVEATDKTSN